MYKHNRNRPHETRIPVGLPLDVEGFRQYLREKGIAASVQLVSEELQQMRRELLDIIDQLDATDEDLE